MAIREADFDGAILVIAPHMDDESLGCGLLLASRPDKKRVHVVFVTDGSHSPARAGQSLEAARNLARVRQEEALAALEVLGVPADNAEFLGFEDGTLDRSGSRLEAAIVDQVQQRGVAFVFVPFRYDRHPDHLAINRATWAARRRGAIEAAVVEYFVYSQWRLLRSGDVRDYLFPGLLRRLEAGPATPLKRRALECHRSQVTRYFDWQARPILTAELLDRVCAEPETFLVQDPAREGQSVLARGRTWVPIAHRAEPVLKRWKDRLAGWKGA